MKKLSGFVLSTTEQLQQRQQRPAQQSSAPSSSASSSGSSPRMGAIREVVDFIKALTMADGHGRILTQPPSEGAPAQLRFLMLNPASFFTPLLQEVRAPALCLKSESATGFSTTTRQTTSFASNMMIVWVVNRAGACSGPRWWDNGPTTDADCRLLPESRGRSSCR